VIIRGLSWNNLRVNTYNFQKFSSFKLKHLLPLPQKSEPAKPKPSLAQAWWTFLLGYQSPIDSILCRMKLRYIPFCKEPREISFVSNGAGIWNGSKNCKCPRNVRPNILWANCETAAKTEKRDTECNWRSLPILKVAQEKSFESEVRTRITNFGEHLPQLCHNLEP